jgi:hypothetical protein
VLFGVGRHSEEMLTALSFKYSVAMLQDGARYRQKSKPVDTYKVPTWVTTSDDSTTND